MPERNILHVWATWKYSKYYRKSIYRYYAAIKQETAYAFDLTGDEEDDEFIVSTLNAILDKDGNILKIVNERVLFKTWKYQNQIGGYTYGVIIPDKLIRGYGIRKDEYLDVTFEAIRKGRKTIKIFPRMLRYGKLSITPKATLPKETILPDILIKTEFDDIFYSCLILEINQAYGYGLYRSTLVLIRVLFENLLVDLLRLRYGMSRLELFYDKAHHRHHSLSVLLSNIKKNIADFKPYSDAFNGKFLSKIEKFKQRGDASAHILEEEISSKFFKENKDDINYICNLLKMMIEKMK